MTKPIQADLPYAPAARPRAPGRPRLFAFTGLEELGRGRSGVVYRGRDADGRVLACKVFEARGLTRLVQWVFLGAPNPYLWCEDAVRCAALRRTILAELVPVWFGRRLAVPAVHGFGWNDERRAHELATAFVAGRPPLLHHPRRTRGSDETKELRQSIMRPLQARLIESGFDGLVWQAGKGNPVALNNFLRVDGPTADAGWAWIDLESGVPALFPLDPRALFGFYLPCALRYDRPLFDDVDTERLRRHLASPVVRAELDDERGAALARAVDELERRQVRWKSLRRHERMIGYRLARGAIDEELAARYRARPVRWYARELRVTLVRVPAKTLRLARAAWRRLATVPYGQLIRGVLRFLTSQRYRHALARRHVSRRIHAWEVRGQMDRRDADLLRSHLAREESTAYLSDFGVHLAIKPFVKAVEYWLFPALFALGFVGEGTVALAMLTGGALARTLYTSGRLVQSWLHGRERPWAALAVGVLPVVGNFAYPLQIVWSSTEQEDDLARFILYDGFARIGAHLPIWGGKDTLTEHVLNRLPDRIIGLRGDGRSAG